MKIVKLMGGLGNQMFQYAFGYALSKKYKHVYFDKTAFNVLHERFPRNYELGLFPNLQINFKNKCKFLPYHKKTEKDPFGFDKTFFKAHINEYFEGYFQCEKYFLDISDEIRNIFTFPEFKSNDIINKKWANKISKCENPVFIHIRRGDYVELNGGWLLEQEYYRRAVKYIKKHIKNPAFFLFSDADEDYIKNNLDIGCDFEYIGTHNSKENQNFRDMQLMSLCKHAIIANSSFSWWGAWLIKNPNKIVCGPSPWIEYDSEIICDNWVKIPRH